MDFRNDKELDQENYRQQISRLKRENEGLTKILYEANEKLRESERLKGHFISNITNEIVNPFTSVLALASSIKQLKDNEMKKAHHMAELIFEEAFHLDFQLKNIFAIAFIEAGKDEANYSMIDLDELANYIKQSFRILLDKKQISMSINFPSRHDMKRPLKFISDREKLELIVKNLISNSIKYSPEGSEIMLSIEIVEGKLTIEVSDRGSGISIEDREVIFDRFKRLDERINSVNSGHGLGLTIVEAYAGILDGWVSIEDNKGGGTVVKVSVPQGRDSEEWDDLNGFILGSETSY